MTETSDVTELVDRYIAMWNETDAARRRALIARIWTESASYVDPMMEGDGRSGIDAMVDGVQQRFPGYRFRRTSEVEAHHDRLRFCWELAPESGPALVKGTDMGVVADGKLAAITGFFDQAPQ
jgi:SnoaL-like domain